jgi:hypothetical protein
MPRTYNESNAQCPFFLSCGKVSISCEGITDDCKLKLLFNKEEDRELHREIFCDRTYKNCEIYSMLVKKYEED